MKQKINYLLAVCAGILPVNIIMVWYRLTHTSVFTLSDMLVYPLIIGGGNILLILALNRYLLKATIRGFNPGKGTWYRDLLAGVALTGIYFLLTAIERVTILKYLPPGKPPSTEVINLMTGLANNPVLMIIWLGPVVWIGVALFEELQRVFFMNCLWKLSNTKYWDYLVIIISSIVWGIVHLYQGAFGIISISIQGLIMGLYYYKFRRIWALIISHALFDSIQVLIFVIQVT